MAKQIPNLIELLVSAIASAEGYFVPASLPNRLNNPGDLRPWKGCTLPIEHNFVHPRTIEEGTAIAYRQVAIDIARGWSLRQLVYSWAPTSDANNSALYLSETARRIGMATTDIDTPLWNFLALDHIP